MESPSIRQKGLEALKQGDFGEEVGTGLHIKDLGRVVNLPKKEETETADPIDRRTPKTTAEREEMVGAMAARVMDHYIANLNNEEEFNPIRDGIPHCVKHTFPPGCVYGCQEGVYTRIRDNTLGDTFEWIKALARKNYKRLVEVKGWKGWSGSI